MVGAAPQKTQVSVCIIGGGRRDDLRGRMFSAIAPCAFLLGKSRVKLGLSHAQDIAHKRFELRSGRLGVWTSTSQWHSSQ